MSYLVLARKYRPQTFADIVGQEHVVRTLQNAIKLDRVHHAFLFTGARGVGKTTTARVLARALNCAAGPTPTPCGHCPACTEIAAGSSPDVLEIDGASNTGVDNVRELRENVRYLPSRGKFKLYIIDEVHMLSQAAFNALLKTLEEPPPHVKFIFATTEPQKIPVTILSRCQRFDFRRVSVAQLTEHLRSILAAEQVQMSPGSVTAIVREAQGSVRDALSLLDQVLSYAGGAPTEAQVIEALGVVDRQTIFDLCDAMLQKNAQRLLELVAEVDARGHDLGDVAGLVVEHLRDLMVVKTVAEPSEALLDRSPGEIEALRQQGEAHSTADLHRLFALMVEVAEDVARSSQARVSLEMGLLRLLEVEPTQSLQTLLERLDALVGGASEVSASAPPVGSGSGAPGAAGERRAAADERAVGPQPPASWAAEGQASAPDDSGAIASGDTTQKGALATVSTEPAGSAASPALTSAATGEQDGWRRLVQRVRAARPAAASVLEHGHVMQFSADGVTVGYAAGTFYWEQARDPETRNLVERLLAEHFGRPVRLRFEALDEKRQGPASLAEVSEQKRRDREQQIRDGAMAHPAVQDALSILGGEVKEVIPLATGDEGDGSQAPAADGGPN